MPKLSDLLSDGSKKELLDHKKELQHIHNHLKNKELKKENSISKIKTPPDFFPVPEFVALDVETTGLDFRKDRIIEIGLVKFKNGKIIDELSTFINPEVNVPEIITELTGINDKDLYNAPKFSEIADQILKFIDNLPICGHQIDFDISFLKEELKRLSKETISGDFIDTALLARIILFNNERFSLKKVCEVLNVKLENAHRALNDARACGEIAIKLLPNLSKLPLSVRQNIALYAPASFFKNLVFKTIKGKRAYISLETREENIDSTSFLKSLSDTKIDSDLLLNILLKAKKELSLVSNFSENFITFYKKISSKIIDTLNRKSIYVAEISAGYERLFAYIIPLVYYAIIHNKRVILSIRDKKSKEIVSKKILPFLSKTLQSPIKYTELKKKENYLCLYRFEELLKGNFGNLSPKERFAILPLIVWSNNSFTGDIEEQHSFNPKWFLKIWNLISAENCSCTKECPYFSRCFWQKAQRKADNSNIVFVNDSLLFTENQFLEKNIEEILVIDDAHLLNYNCSKSHSVEIDTNRINLFLDLVNNLYHLIEKFPTEKEFVEIVKKFNKTLKYLRKESSTFLNKLASIAISRDLKNSEYEFIYNREIFNEIKEKDTLLYYLEELIDILINLKQIFNFFNIKNCNFIKSLVQSTREIASELKADFIYLTYANTENHIFIISGSSDNGWVKLRGIPISNVEFMSYLWNRHKGSILFISQSLSIEDNFEYFKEKSGLNKCEKYIISDIIRTSEINTENSIMLCSLNSDLYEISKNSIDKVEQIITLFHNSLNKNLLILSGKDEILKEYYKKLKNNPKIDKHKIYLNAITLNKHFEVEGITKDSRNILLSSELFLNQLELKEVGLETILILDIPTYLKGKEDFLKINNKNTLFPYPLAEKLLKIKLYKGVMLNYDIRKGILIILDNIFTEEKFIEIAKKSVEIEFKFINSLNEFIETIKKYYSL